MVKIVGPTAFLNSNKNGSPATLVPLLSGLNLNRRKSYFASGVEFGVVGIVEPIEVQPCTTTAGGVASLREILTSVVSHKFAP